MKKIVTLCLMLSMLMSLPLCLVSCAKLPADFVRGDEVIIDNETPFVYDDSTVKYYYETYNGEEIPYDVDFFCDILAQNDEREFTYQQIASVFGNKILRHYTESGKDTYYTIYSLPDNQLFYVSFYLKDGTYYLEKDLRICINETYDIRDEGYLIGYIYEQDMPSAILGDKLPSFCYLENIPPEEVERQNNLTWEFYSSFCDSAGMTSNPFVSDYYCSLYAEERHKEVDGVLRCMQSVAFDTEIGDPDSEDYTAHHGAYTYDIYVFNDGTGILFFTHFNTDTYPRYTAWQTDEIALSKAEVDTLKSLLDQWDFGNIPTWNPEEFSGLDGENTYVYSQGLGHHNLISMWQSNERYGIYHIREAIEEIVRSHVTVKLGRIYNESRFND
jgi:hypothetical protein